MDTEEIIENACEWIETLAANEFKQNQGQLGDESTGFCCLGVANFMFNFGGDYSDTNLTPSGFDALGITYAGASLAISLNDDYSYSFPEIARELISKPCNFFPPAVAQGIKEHFWQEAAA